MGNDLFVLVAAVAITSTIVSALMWVVLPRVKVRLADQPDYDVELERLQSEVQRLHAQDAQRLEEIKRLNVRLEHEIAERNRLLQQFPEFNRQIAELQKKVADLQQKNATLEAQIGNRDKKQIAILGIWSGDDLNIIAERNAIYDAGFEYHALVGGDATRSKILRELRTGKYAIIEIGAHGDADAILINRQELSAGWWQQALHKRGVRVAVVLACFSDDSVADAMKRAGVQHVIGVNGEIEDESAIEFAEQFYQLFANGLPVEDAFKEAKLALDLEQSQKLVLR